MSKTKVIVLYGGKSAEHEISCRSAAFVFSHLNRDLYDVIPVAISKQGQWIPQQADLLLDQLKKAKGSIDIEPTKAHLPSLPTNPDTQKAFLTLTGSHEFTDDCVVFPVLHGTFGEDGTLQGMLDLAEIAYVGSDTLGSSVGMDKVVAKKLVQAAGVKVVPWVDVRADRFETDATNVLAEAVAKLGYPMFVKPASLGSSVGISKVETVDALEAGCREAFRFDEKILIEKGLDVREIECAVLGAYEPEVSVPGEVAATGEFYSYDAKYVDPNGAEMQIPANLSVDLSNKARELSKTIFQSLELYGMARVDLFLEKESNEYYFNEVNTIPGLTSISQFPLLWTATGMPPEALLNRLIDLAKERRNRRCKLRRQK